MSEHQCYEFLALERPLTPKQMDELRAVSSRAEITPARFCPTLKSPDGEKAHNPQ